MRIIIICRHGHSDEVTQMQKRLEVMSRARLTDDAHSQVVYHSSKDMVVLEVGGTSLKLNARNFMRMHEMMRKAAARLVMETDIN